MVRHELDITCSPDLIPDVINIDLSGLEIGDSVHISEVKLPEGVETTISDRDFTIATIAAAGPSVEEQEEAAEAEAEAAEAESDDEASEEGDAE